MCVCVCVCVCVCMLACVCMPISVYTQTSERADTANSTDNERRAERLPQKSLLCLERNLHHAQTQEVLDNNVCCLIVLLHAY